MTEQAVCRILPKTEKYTSSFLGYSGHYFGPFLSTITRRDYLCWILLSAGLFAAKRFTAHINERISGSFKRFTGP